MGAAQPAATDRPPSEVAEGYSQYGPLKADTAAAVIDLLPKAKALFELRETLVAQQQIVAGNPKVAAFLHALADNRATLDFLEPEVLEWLKGQGALTSLKVTAAF